MSSLPTQRDCTALLNLAAQLGVTFSDITFEREYRTLSGVFRTHWVTINNGDPVRLVCERPAKYRNIDSVAQVDDGNGDADVWAFPGDPELPALALFVHPQATADLLKRFGITDDLRSVEMIRYHPGQRGVFRIEGALATTFAKVVQPTVTEQIVQAYAHFTKHDVRVPRVLGHSSTGFLLFNKSRGSSGDELLREGSFSHEQLELSASILRSFPKQSAPLEYTRPTFDHQLTQVVQAFGAHGTQPVTRLIESAQGFYRSCEDNSEPPTLTHGDFHPGQIMFTQAGTSTLLDVDEAGLGDPAEDVGRYAAYLIAQQIDESLPDRQHCETWAMQWLELFTTEGTEFLNRAQAWAIVSLLTHVLGAPTTKIAEQLTSLGDVLVEQVPALP